MTALSDNSTLDHESWDYHEFTLASTKIAYKGGLCAIKLGTGKVVPSTGASDELVIGRFAQYRDATSADKLVNVRLNEPFEAHWMANGSSIASTDLGAICYVADDQTVSLSPKSTGMSVAGRVWAVDSVRGVAVQLSNKLNNGGALAEQTALSFTAGDVAIGNNPASGSIFDIPTTATNSTVSLPATAREGTVLTFVADGTKNGHTITYRDVTTAISAALTASKRHQARAVYLNGGWTILTTVSP